VVVAHSGNKGFLGLILKPVEVVLQPV